jgi:hypothetical protein
MFSSLAIPVVALLAISALANWTSGTLAQDTTPAAVSPQVPAPKTPADVTPPATGVVMHPAYAKAVATNAYVWGWPMVNQFNRRAVVGSVQEPGRLQGVVPAGPRGRIGMLTDYITAGQTFVSCPNQDAVYGYGFAYADEEPVVIQVPDFGDRYWIIAVWDARTDSVGRLGKQYGTKPGSYLVVGLNWKGSVPEGISGVIRSRTELVTIIPRLFMDDTAEDRKAVQPVINQIVVYPLKEYDGRLCQLSHHKGEADDVGRSNLVYAAAIMPSNRAKRS